MNITDSEFPSLWKEISEALVRIAGQISPVKKNDWQVAIASFLTNPLTAEDERNVLELQWWYRNDMDLKDYMEQTLEDINKRLRETAVTVEEFRTTMNEGQLKETHFCRVLLTVEPRYNDMPREQ